MKTFCFILMLSIAVFTTGCPRTTPVKPAVVAKVAEYELNQLDTNLAAYDCAIFGKTVEITESTRGKGQQNRTITCANDQPDFDKAKRIRDATIHRLIRTIDHVYFQFENELYIKRTSGSFLSDVTDIGANFAATITNGERAKTIINAAIIGFRGGRKSGSIHFFQEKTAEALISSMQSARNRVLADMIERLRKEDVEKYSLDEALGDTIKYFYAGTLPRALQELQQNASKIAADTKEQVRVVKGLTPEKVVTAAQAKPAVDALEALKKLFNDATKGTPDSVKTDARAKAEKILEQINDDKTLVDEINKDEKLKGILAKLNDKAQTDSAEKLIRGINELKTTASHEALLKGPSLEKIDKLIVDAVQKK